MKWKQKIHISGAYCFLLMFDVLLFHNLIFIYYVVNHNCECLQMSAYFAPAIFGHLLGKCLRRKNPFLEVSKLGLVVLGTFAVIWWPYLHSQEAIFLVNTNQMLFCLRLKIAVD